MGAQLANFYDQVSKEFGPIGRMNLALLTKISSDKANTEPDSKENVNLFQHAVAQLKQQMKK